MKIGLVGHGPWGARWAAAIGEDLAWVADPDPTGNVDARLYATDDLASVLATEEGTVAVVIATPAATHVPLAAIAAEHWVHAIVEKPVGLSYAEASYIAEMFRKRQLILMPGHTFLYDLAVQRILTYLDRDNPPLRYGRFVWTAPGSLRDDADITYNVGVHPISILAHMGFTDPQTIMRAGSGWGSDQREMEVIWLRYESGFCAEVFLSCIDPAKRRRVSLVGDSWSVEADCVVGELVSRKSSTMTLEDIIDWASPMERMLEAFKAEIDSQRTDGREQWYTDIGSVGYLLEQSSESVLGFGPGPLLGSTGKPATVGARSVARGAVNAQGEGL